MRQLKISPSITDRESASFNRYLQDISNIPMVSQEEEIILAQQIRQGDAAALERLTTANLRFVVSIAKQYQNQGIALSDLVNEGNLGLTKAAGRFDETKGFKFISYAVWWIRQAIIQALADQSRDIRLPLNQIAAMSKIRKASSALEQQLEREPTDQELADMLDTSAYGVIRVIEYGKKSSLLDKPLSHKTKGGAEVDTLLDITASEDLGTDHGVMSESLRTDIVRLLSGLDERSRKVLMLFYGIGTPHDMSLEEIGCRLGLTRERVRQIKDKAVRSLKNKARKANLNDYLQ